MSKAVAEVIPNVVGIEIAWVDTWNKPPTGTRLYTTDHAEELAAVLTKILHGSPLEYLHSDNVKAASLAINNYREATK
jgi:hypothetical protein